MADLNLPVRYLLASAVTLFCVIHSGISGACEKHLNGHQNSSDTNIENTKK